MADGFVTINYTVLLDKDLLLIEKVVYGAIYGLCSMRGYAWASNKYLAELLHVSERTITRSVARLSELGYVITKIEKNRSENGQITTQRHIYLTEKGTIGGTKIPEIDDRVDTDDTENDRRVDTDVHPPLDTDGEYNINNINIKNLRTQSVRLGQSGKQKSSTVQVENILNEEYKKLEQEGNKIIKIAIPIQRKIIKNILQYFDNDINWIKEYIRKALNDSYVIKQCYSCLAIFSKSVIQKYLNDTKPRRYNNEQPQLPESETDKMLESMTPEERAKWIENKLKEFMDAKK